MFQLAMIALYALAVFASVRVSSALESGHSTPAAIVSTEGGEV